MIIVTKYVEPDSTHTPVEYIGIVVPPYDPHLIGRVTLLAYLQNNDANKLSEITMTCTAKEHLLSLLADLGKKKYGQDFEIHIIECSKSTSEMFNVLAYDLPSPEEFHKFVLQAVKTYDPIFDGSLKLVNIQKQPTPENKNTATPEVSKNTSHVSTSNNSFFSNGSSSSTMTNTNTENLEDTAKLKLG